MLTTNQYQHTGYDIVPNVLVQCCNMLEIDFSDADVILLPSTSFKPSFMKKITAKCEKLKPGTRILTFGKPMPSVTESDCHVVFNVCAKTPWLMSWGLEPVFYNVKT